MSPPYRDSVAIFCTSLLERWDEDDGLDLNESTMLLNQADLHSPNWALAHPVTSHSLVAEPIVPVGQEEETEQCIKYTFYPSSRDGSPALVITECDDQPVLRPCLKPNSRCLVDV